jgi:hypothetical protein
VSDEIKKLFGVNFNSLLMFALLGLVGWMATETRSNGLALTEVRTTQALTGKSNAEALGRLEGALNNSVSRREFDGRVLAIEARLAEVSLKMREIDISLMRLQAAKP